MMVLEGQRNDYDGKPIKIIKFDSPDMKTHRVHSTW